MRVSFIIIRIMPKAIYFLVITLLVICTLADEFDPDYSYSDFMRQFNRNYQGNEKAAHEAAFKKNYAELLRLKREGKDVAINDRLDWTDEQKGGIFLVYT